MSKVIKINNPATIKYGFCKGLTGNVVAYDSEINEVSVKIDEWSIIQTVSENIEQNEQVITVESIVNKALSKINWNL